MRDRLARLQQLLDAQRHGFNHSLVGSRQPVLLEKPGRLPGQLVGKTPYMQPVHLYASTELIGTVRIVDIVASAANSLEGVLSSDTRTAA
jgi:tRNA-2-methylthio-N6-dimethylallyladenosine synthase